MEELQGSRAYEVLTKRTYFPTIVKEKTIPVSTTPKEVVEVNPRRLLLLLVNHGTENVRVAFSAENVLNYGLVIAPYGGSLSLLIDEDFEVVTYNIYAQSPTMTNYLYVLEVIAQ